MASSKWVFYLALLHITVLAFGAKIPLVPLINEDTAPIVDIEPPQVLDEPQQTIQEAVPITQPPSEEPVAVLDGDGPSEYLATDEARKDCYQWTSKVHSEAFTARQGVVAWAVEEHNALYAFGGCEHGKKSTQCSTDFLRFDRASNTWSVVPLAGVDSSNVALHMQGVASDFDASTTTAYLFGGDRGLKSHTVGVRDGSMLTRSLDEITLLPDCEGENCWAFAHIEVADSDVSPPAVMDASLTMVGDTLVVFGGYSDEGVFNDVYTIDISGPNAWKWVKQETRGTPPAARSGHTATLVGNRLTIFGGTNGGQAFNDVWSLSLGASNTNEPVWTWYRMDAWGTGTVGASPRFHHTANRIANSGDGSAQLLVVGGCNPVNSECYNDVHVLRLKANTDVESGYDASWATLPASSALTVSNANESANRISSRMRHSAVYLASTQEIGVLGGCGLDQCYDELVLLDLQAVCPNSCGEYGTYKESNGVGQCECQGDWEGQYCEDESPCLNDCSGRGTCSQVAGYHICHCHDGWFGADCSFEPCPRNCSAHGRCERVASADDIDTSLIATKAGQKGVAQGVSVCKCHPGFSGEGCELKGTDGEMAELQGEALPNFKDTKVTVTLFEDNKVEEDKPTPKKAIKHLRFVPKATLALANARASAAGSSSGSNSLDGSGLSCENDCSGHGDCVEPDSYDETVEGYTGVCDCDDGYSGDDCSVTCYLDCSGNGECQDDGTCDCDTGYSGDGCEDTYCAYNCSSHGVCVDDQCYCSDTYVGTYCQTDTSCSGNGDYVDDECDCWDGYGLDDCSATLNCPNRCSGHGTCTEYESDDDSDELFLVETATCEGDGCDSDYFLEGFCVCDDGYEGQSCQEKTCDNDCSGNGHCWDGICNCYPGYKSSDCSTEVYCPNNCTEAQDDCEENHGTCLPTGDCQCAKGWTGDDCADTRCQNDCSGVGTCDDGYCICDDGYYLSDCSASCPNQCSGHGDCVEGLCDCDIYYEGEDCGTKKECPTDDDGNECSNNGVCYRSKKECYCPPEWEGEACQTNNVDCGDDECNDRGICKDGVCFCDFGWDGDHCDERSQCANDCNGKGFCDGGVCYCFPGWDGDECDIVSAEYRCPGNCTSKGICEEGKCWCVSGYGGDDCTVDIGFCQENDCNGNGYCEYEMCWCDPGYYGDNCEHSGCKNGCDEDNGVCYHGVCYCYSGYEGDDCSTEISCPGGTGSHSCTGHGICVQGTCACEYGWGSDDCSERTVEEAHCPDECSDLGVCREGKCFCLEGYLGDDCSIKTVDACTESCSEAHGTCLYGECFCEPGYVGEGCEEEKECDENCEKNGVCMYGECFCISGYTGDACSEIIVDELKMAVLDINYKVGYEDYEANDDGSCLHGCSMHGLCVDGLCYCETGFYGEDCSHIYQGLTAARCAYGCNDHGTCVYGKCECMYGYGGRYCEEELEQFCPDNCNGNGDCIDGRCHCDAEYRGLACDENIICDLDCGSHGVCLYEDCMCAVGFTGDGCHQAGADEPKPDKEDYASETGELLAFREVQSTIEAVQAVQVPTEQVVESCPKSCGVHGVCHNQECYCAPGFTGESCVELISALASREAKEAIAHSPDLLASKSAELSQESSDHQVSPILICLACFALGVVVSSLAKCLLDKRKQARTQMLVKSLLEEQQQPARTKGNVQASR